MHWENKGNMLKNRICFIVMAALFANNANAYELNKCPNVMVSKPIVAEHSDEDFNDYLLNTPANSANCNKGIKIEIEGAQIWRCRIDYDKPYKDWESAFLIIKNGKEIFKAKDDLMAGMYETFYSIKADLNADGKSENIIALWNAQGNGMGVNTWTLYTFDNAWKQKGKAIETRDWGPNSFVKTKNGCDIIISDWAEDFSKKPSGAGYKGVFYSYGSNGFTKAKGKPILMRRLYDSFDIERGEFREKSDENQYIGDPIGWLSKNSYIVKK